MKLALSLAAALTTAASIAFAQQSAAGHDHAPKHGGVVMEVHEVDYELVAKADLIQLYVSDHGKPVDLSKASAKLTLLTGSDKQEVELKPAGGRLESAGVFKVAKGTKVAAAVTRGGKVTTVRFVVK